MRRLHIPLIVTSRASSLIWTRLYLLQSRVVLLSPLLTESCGPSTVASTLTMSAGLICSTTSTVFSGVGDGAYFSTLFLVIPLCTSHAVSNKPITSTKGKVKLFIIFKSTPSGRFIEILLYGMTLRND